jgi:fructooligosaccharide transport system substrate-binding protein
MKKTLYFSLSVLFIVSLLLTACAAPEPVAEEVAEEPAAEEAVVEEEAAEEMAEEKEPVTLTYWHAMPAPPLEPAMAALVDQFEEEYPWITVNVETFGFGEYFQKIDTATAGGSAPDVYFADVTAISRYSYYDMLVPLDDYLPEGFKEDYFSAPRGDMAYDGVVWAIPVHQSTDAMLYNKDLTDAAGLEIPQSYDDPWSFEDFRAAMEAVSVVSDDGMVEVWGYTSHYPPATYTVQPLVYAQGARFTDEAETVYTGYTDSAETAAAFQWYVDMYVDQLAPIDRIPDIFQTGKVAFYDANPFVVLDIEERYPDFNLGVAPLPCGSQCAVQSGAWHLGIHTQSEYPDEAWMLIDYLTNAEGHKQWIETSGYMPARISVYEQLDYLKEYPWNVFMDGLADHAVSRPSNPGWSVFDQEMKAAITNCATGADVQGELDRIATMADEELSNFK